MKNVRNIIYKRIQKIESAEYCGPPPSRGHFKKLTIGAYRNY